MLFVQYLCVCVNINQRERERAETEPACYMTLRKTRNRQQCIIDQRVLQHTDLMQRGHSKSDTVRTPRVFALQWLLSSKRGRERSVITSYWRKKLQSFCNFKPSGGNYGKAVCMISWWGQWWWICICTYPSHAHLPSSSSSPRPLQQQGGRKRPGRGWGSIRYPSHASPWSP